MERNKHLLTPEEGPSLDQKNDKSKPSLVNHCVYYYYLPVYEGLLEAWLKITVSSNAHLNMDDDSHKLHP